MLAYIDVDKFVWNDCHFLQFKRLDTCARESLDDPTELLFLILFNLSSHKVDYDLIIN